MELLALVLAGVLLWIGFGFRRRLSLLEERLAHLQARLDGTADPREGEAGPSPRSSGEDADDAPPLRLPWPGMSARGKVAGTASAGADAGATGGQADTGPPQAGQPKAGRALDPLSAWLRDNWIYPAAGAALVLAGVFLVQYAVEQGLLTPVARIVLALLMGLAMTLAGEALRRLPAAGPILPATLSGAGIVVMMAAVLGALHLYALIGDATALLALAILALGAIGLGWVHGPFLAALGLVAGTAAPFMLGGGGPPPAALFGYFALLALIGLGIDAARRWGWVTWLALVAPLAAMILWRLAGGDAPALAMALLVVAGAAMTLPFGRVAPMVTGAPALGRGTPATGVRASFAATAVAAGAIGLLVPGLAGPVSLLVLAVLVAIWCRRAPALADQMLLPLLAFPLWIVNETLWSGPLWRAFTAIRLPESAMPLQAGQVLVLALLAGAAFLWRSEQDAPGRHAPWTLAGLALPGATIVALEIFWQPSAVIGAWPWALHAMALAGAATALALRYATRDAGQGPRLGAASVAAFALIALGMTLLIGQAALTLALAVLMISAAAMDRRFDIPALAVFQVAAAFALMWRLLLNPGLDWHWLQATLPELLLSLAATLAGPVLALWLAQGLAVHRLRSHAALVLETMAVVAAAIAAGLLFLRLLPDEIGQHATLGLQASVLMLLAWLQLRRAELPPLPRVRRGLAWLLAGVAGVLMGVALITASPVIGDGFLRDRVAGWPLINDLIPAYLIPALILIVLGRSRLWRAIGWAIFAVWVGSAIRHLWQGPDIALARGIAQGELYAYTFALLVGGMVLVGRAILSARPDLRRLGLALVGAAAAKAFLVDAAGLDGLLRVGAFLGLGLSLAALAWVNGRAVAREHPRGDEEPHPDPNIR